MRVITQQALFYFLDGHRKQEIEEMMYVQYAQ